MGCASLPPGAHFGEVLGTDTTKSGLGALFRVPVSVIKPHADLLAGNGGCSYAAYEGLPFTPGHIERRFVVPPAGATWATVVLEVRGAPRSRETDGGQTIFMLHTTQLLPSKRIQEWSTRVSLGLPKEAKAPSTQYVHSVAVTGGVTMEVTVAQWWMALGDTEATLKVDFHGVSPLPAALALDGRTLFTEFQLHSSVRRTPVEPAGKLTTLERAVRPHSAKLLPPVAALPGAPGFGDAWPESRVLYDYVLGYKFSLKEGVKEGGVDVSVRFPSLNCQLYDSPYEAQLFAVFDCNKRLITHGDYYESKVKLAPGEYEVRLQLRHDAAPTSYRHSNELPSPYYRSASSSATTSPSC